MDTARDQRRQVGECNDASSAADDHDHRPPDQVFAFFTDPDNDLRWRSHVKEASADGPIRVGSSVHQVVSGPGGRSIPADLEVTAHDPPSREMASLDKAKAILEHARH
jgi:hypothetical protein